jgi:pimeloyl-ACP methyl ester carboxylesterase
MNILTPTLIRVTLSLMHPRLFHSLVLLDPTIQRQSTQSDEPKESNAYTQNESGYTPTTTLLSTYRRDIWPSRQAAAESFKRSAFYQKWNPRVLDRWIKYGLRELPTAIYPLDDGTTTKDQRATAQSDTKHDGGSRPVTLSTTRHQEVFTFSRPNYDYNPVTNRPVSTLTHPDLNPLGENAYPFYRPEPIQIFEHLPNLRPSVLYVFGGDSDLSIPILRDSKLKYTGIGTGGSGGVAAKRVRSIVLEGVGHLVAQEAVEKCAAAAAEFLGTELRRWQVEDAAFQVQWNKKSKVQKTTIDEKWLKMLGPPLGRRSKRNGGAGSEKL